MKTLLAIALCFCVGCGVSEQEKLAKRINDAMDRAEKVDRVQKKIDQRNITERIRITKILLEQAKAGNKQLDFEIKQDKLELQKKRQELWDLKNQYPVIFPEENDK